MPGGADLDALYKKWPIVLWVEDETTRLYLDALWRDPQIGLLVAGGCDNLGAFIQQSRKTAPNVFGYRDLDFGQSNRPKWEAVEVFQGDTFEIENFLLDEGAMANCSLNSRGLSATDLLAEMQRIAGEFAWTMAARSTIVWLRSQLLTNFIAHPGRPSVPDRTSALASILGSPWWTTTRPGVRLLEDATVERQIDDAHARYAACLTDGSWKRDFSGKEIWSRVWSKLWNTNTPPSGEMDTVKAIAASQRASLSVPEELAHLREQLRRRPGGASGITVA